MVSQLFLPVLGRPASKEAPSGTMLGMAHFMGGKVFCINFTPLMVGGSGGAGSLSLGCWGGGCWESDSGAGLGVVGGIADDGVEPVEEGNTKVGGLVRSVLGDFQIEPAFGESREVVG